MATPQNGLRKKSPRAPSISLDEALEKSLRIYEKERIHPTPADVAAQAMGYKDANNGRALTAIASLRYYGLIDRVGDGKLAVSKDVEAYKYSPSAEVSGSYLRKFVATPPLFAELLDRYSTGLPSDGTLRYDLIQRGFLPNGAEAIVTAFRRSVEFSNVFQHDPTPSSAISDEESDSIEQEAQAVGITANLPDPAPPSVDPAPRSQAYAPPQPSLSAGSSIEDDSHDRIPVRLSQGRRAWLLIPATFYEADKQRLKAHIDLLMTEEDE